MTNPLGIYHDIDGCTLMDKGRMVYRSTFFCRYNDIDLPRTVAGILANDILDQRVIGMYEVEFGDIHDPSDLIRLGEYARFDENVRKAGLGIESQAMHEIERRAVEGLPRDAFDQALSEAELVPGLGNFPIFAGYFSARSFIVTTGWKQVGEYVASQLNMPRSNTSRLGVERAEYMDIAGAFPEFVGGRFTGNVVELGPKKPIIDDYMKKLGLRYEDSMGKDDSDPVIGEFGLPIAFNPTNPKLRDIPGVVVIEEPQYRLVSKAAMEWFGLA